MRIFAQLRKVDLETRKVWGRATQEVPDRANEIFDYATSKPHFEKWSNDMAKATEAAGQEVSLGNIREMHGKSAAGKVVEIDFNDADKAIDIVTEIVDDAAWEKVKKGVYTGFSIGGSYLKKWKDETVGTLTRFTAGPAEISLVDLACVPTATFSMVKAAGASEEVALHPYGLLREQVARTDLTLGELLVLVKDYLPGDQQDTLLQKDATAGDFLETLRAMVAPAATPTETPAPLAKDGTPAEESPATPPAPAAPTDGIPAETVPTGSEGDEATKLAAATAQKAAAKAARVTAVAETLKKGMYDVGRLAEMLQSIAYMAMSAESEKGWEKDASTVPDELRAWLALGVEIFKKMSVEETAELIAMITPEVPVVVEVVELAATGDMAKAGARHSKDDLKQLQDMHDASVTLGASCGTAKAAEPADLAKGFAAVITGDRLTLLNKALHLVTGTEPAADAVVAPEQLDAVATFAIAKAAEVVTLGDRVKALEAMPVEGKGVLRVVTKAGDLADASVDTTEATPDPKDPLAVMKKVHASGGVRVLV